MEFEWLEEDEEDGGDEKIVREPFAFPSVRRTVLPDGTVEHRDAQGQLHRLDGPAFEGADGTKWWYQNGLLHRLDGPASEWANGSREWWICGVKQTNPIGE